MVGREGDLASRSGDDEADVDGDGSNRDFLTLRSNGMSSFVPRFVDDSCLGLSDLDVDEFVFSSMELTGDRSVEFGVVVVDDEKG